MIRSAVTISLVEEARGGPFVFWHDLAGACALSQKLGFDAVEVFPPGPDSVDPARLRFLFQGVSDDDRRGKPYGEIPWRLGLLEPDRPKE